VSLIVSVDRLVGLLFTLMAVGSGVCFTIASSITGKYSDATVTDWNTAGFALATAVAVTPLALTNVVKVILGRARAIQMTKKRRFLFLYFAFLATVLVTCLSLRFAT
jgi:magnesium-transporting ATPase (P-type)